MGRIPAPALLLGLGGLIPFLYAAAATLAPDLQLSPRFPPLAVFDVYGVVIFCFMAGCLWGFAAKDGADLMKWLGLSVIPAIAIFYAVLLGGPDLIVILMVAFPALLVLDIGFARAGLAPDWWLPLRYLLTAVVTACLAVGAFA
ncbi:MAG: DUF3429 domain-containing protein [Pseudomonadota bacterium]